MIVHETSLTLRLARRPAGAAVAATALALAALAALAATAADTASPPRPAPATAPAMAPAADKLPVAYPSGYRDWTHVKSMIVEPGHPLAGLVEGTHHLYANATAMRAYRGKRPFADGAVIVLDLLTTRHGDLAVVEGPRKAVIVMQKDSRRFALTNGWGYQVFGGADLRQPQLDAAGASGCHGCHAAQATRDYVFSDWRD